MESIFIIVLGAFLGLSILIAMAGIFLFSGFKWWDKL